MTMVRSAILFLPVLMVLGGCAQPVEVSETHLNSNQSAAVLASADKVLSKMQFDIDKLDIGQGYLRTKPLPAAQFFEFWRDDNTTAGDALEANLHSIRRTVEVRRVDGANFEVAVLTERLSVSGRNASDKPQLSDKFTPTRVDKSRRKIELDPEVMKWVKLGRDSGLEKTITKAINRELIILESEEG